MPLFGMALLTFVGGDEHSSSSLPIWDLKLILAYYQERNLPSSQQDSPLLQAQFVHSIQVRFLVVHRRLPDGACRCACMSSLIASFSLPRWRASSARDSSLRQRIRPAHLSLSERPRSSSYESSTYCPTPPFIRVCVVERVPDILRDSGPFCSAPVCWNSP